MDAEMVTLIVVSGEVFCVGIKEVLKRTGGGRVRLVRRRAASAYLRRAGGPVRLVILDSDAPTADDRDFAQKVRARYPDASILIAAAPGGREEILSYLTWDVQGVVFRNQTAGEIRAAVEIVLRGGIVMPPALAESALRAAPAGTAALAPGRASGELRPAGRPAPLRTLSLSERQHEVLDLLARGFSNKQIARALGLAEATVKVHLNFVFKALNVHNRASAVAAVLSATAPDPEGSRYGPVLLQSDGAPERRRGVRAALGR